MLILSFVMFVVAAAWIIWDSKQRNQAGWVWIPVMLIASPVIALPIYYFSNRNRPVVSDTQPVRQPPVMAWLLWAAFLMFVYFAMVGILREEIGEVVSEILSENSLSQYRVEQVTIPLIAPISSGDYSASAILTNTGGVTPIQLNVYDGNLWGSLYVEIPGSEMFKLRAQ